MGDELADAMGNADLLGASRTSQQRRNTTYPGPDEDLTAWKTQVEIALRGITDPKTKLTLDHVLSSNPRYITVDAVAHDEGGTAAQGGNVLSRDLDGAITPKKLQVSALIVPYIASSAHFCCSNSTNALGSSYTIGCTVVNTYRVINVLSAAFALEISRYRVVGQLSAE